MHQEAHQHQEWQRAKYFRTNRGLSAPQLARYAEDKLIRTSHIRRPGQTRGVRLYHVGDVDRLIIANIETNAKPQTNK